MRTVAQWPDDADEQASIRERYHEIFDRCRNTYGGFIHDADRRKALEVSDEERLAFYEELYAQPGFGIWMGNFRDVLVDQRANATLSEFVARRSVSACDDPDFAEKLIPDRPWVRHTTRADGVRLLRGVQPAQRRAR